MASPAVMDQGRTTALIMLVVFGALAAYGLVAGRTRFYLSFTRAGQPVAYWGIVALWLFMASVGAYRLAVGFRAQ